MTREAVLPFDYSALCGRIREKNYTQEQLANAADMSFSQLSRKLNGHYPFTQTDIQNIVRILEIPPMDIGHYFFTV